MRDRLQGILRILAAGAALLGLHALGGLLLTPFFGATPLFWSTTVVSAPLALGLGLLAGQLAARASEERPWIPGVLGAVAGVLVMAVPVVLPTLARTILDHDPDSRLAAPLAVLILITLPSAAAAATLPGIVERARSAAGGAIGLSPVPAAAPHRTGTSGRGSASGRQPRASARLAPAPFTARIGSPGVPLLLLSLGGTLGIAACAPLLVDPGRGRPWVPLWAFGGALLGASALGLRAWAGALALLAGAALVPAFFVRPNELRDYEFEKALRQAWSLHVGKYYLDTAGKRALGGSEAAREYSALRERIAYASDKSVAAVLVVETLRSLGPATITGDGLREIMGLYLPEKSKARVMSLFNRIAHVRSDGKGEIAFALRRLEPDEDVEIDLVNDRGETTTLEFKSDFTISIRVERERDESRVTLNIGPLTTEKAGFFGSNDTYSTPVVIRDAALFFDAHLLGITVVSRTESVTVYARAQGSVGGVKTAVLQVVDLTVPPE